MPNYRSQLQNYTFVFTVEELEAFITVITSFTGNFSYLLLRRGRFRPRSCFAYCVFLALVSELLVCCIAMITHNEMILLLKRTFSTNYKSI